MDEFLTVLWEAVRALWALELAVLAGVLLGWWAESIHERLERKRKDPFSH